MGVASSGCDAQPDQLGGDRERCDEVCIDREHGEGHVPPSAAGNRMFVIAQCSQPRAEHQHHRERVRPSILGVPGDRGAHREQPGPDDRCSGRDVPACDLKEQRHRAGGEDHGRESQPPLGRAEREPAAHEDEIQRHVRPVERQVTEESFSGRGRDRHRRQLVDPQAATLETPQAEDERKGREQGHSDPGGARGADLWNRWLCRFGSSGYSHPAHSRLPPTRLASRHWWWRCVVENEASRLEARK